MWHTSMEPVTARLGYTTSDGVYLPANMAAGMTITVTTGTATIYAGLPDATSHQVFANLSAGQSFLFADDIEIAAGAVVSVQSQDVFSYELNMPHVTAITWESIPDVVGYINFHIPGCGECGGPPLLEIEPDRDADWWDVGRWFDAGEWLRKLTGGMWNMIAKALCWLVWLFGLLVDLFVQIANIFLGFTNNLWRLFIFMWISFRSVVYQWWNVFQLFLTWLAQTMYFVIWTLALLKFIIEFLLQLVVVIVQILLIFLGFVLRLLAVIGWIVAIALSTSSMLVSAMGVPGSDATVVAYNTPAAISVWNGHPIYSMTRGMLEGLLDSKAGWMVTLLHVLAYIAWVSWLVKFLPAGKEGEKE